MYNPVHSSQQLSQAREDFKAYEPLNRLGTPQFHDKLSGHQTAYQSWQHPHPTSEDFNQQPPNRDFNHLQIRTEFSSSGLWSQRSSSQPLTSLATPFYQPAQLQHCPPHHRVYRDYHLHPTPPHAGPELNHRGQTHSMMTLHHYDNSTLTPNAQVTHHSYTTTTSGISTPPPPPQPLRTPTESTPMENPQTVNLAPSKALFSRDTMAVAASQETNSRATISTRTQTAPRTKTKPNLRQHHLPTRGRRRSIRSYSSSKDEVDDEEEEEEDKYERRRRLNRLSAQRFRERGRALVADLESQVALLQMACMDVEARAAQLEEEKEAWVKEREVLLERVRQFEVIKGVVE